MLDRYLANPPTITEKLLLPQPPEQTVEVVEEKVTPTKELVGECEASWENKG